LGFLLPAAPALARVSGQVQNALSNQEAKLFQPQEREETARKALHLRNNCIIVNV
jgi:hypothetical protein